MVIINSEKGPGLGIERKLAKGWFFPQGDVHTTCPRLIFAFIPFWWLFS